MKFLKLTLIVAFAAVALGHARADAGQAQGMAVGKKGNAASASGVYSGPLSGTIVLGSEMVVVPKKVAIVDLKGKRMAPGSSVSGRSLWVSGQVRDGKLVAGLIVVGEPTSSEDFSEETLPDVLADPDRAR
jgi:hypothetical protein